MQTRPKENKLLSQYNRIYAADTNRKKILKYKLSVEPNEHAVSLEQKTELVSLLLLFKYHEMDQGYGRDISEFMQDKCLEFIEAFCKKYQLFIKFEDCCAFLKSRHFFNKIAIPDSLAEVYKSIPDHDLLTGFINTYQKKISDLEAKTMHGSYKPERFKKDHESFAYIFAFIEKETGKKLINNKHPQWGLMYSTEAREYKDKNSKDPYNKLVRDFYTGLTDIFTDEWMEIYETWGAWLVAYSKNCIFEACVSGKYDTYLKKINDIELPILVRDALFTIPFEDHVTMNIAFQYGELRDEEGLLEKFHIAFVGELQKCVIERNIKEYKILAEEIKIKAEEEKRNEPSIVPHSIFLSQSAGDNSQNAVHDVSLSKK